MNNNRENWKKKILEISNWHFQGEIDTCRHIIRVESSVLEPEPYFFDGAGVEKLCYFWLQLRLQKIPYKWIFPNNLPKKQLKFPLSNNFSVQLAAVMLPSNQKKMKKKIFEMVVMKSYFTVLQFTWSRSRRKYSGS